MKIYRLELKKLVKSRVSAALICGIVGISLLLALVTVFLVRYSYYDGQEVVWTRGFDAIRRIQDIQGRYSGYITAERLQAIYADYKDVYARYGEELPPEVYYEKVYPYIKLLSMVQYEYTDAATGQAPLRHEITSEMALGYYSQRAIVQNTVISNALADDVSAQEHYRGMETKVEKPFYYTPDIGWQNGADYLSMIIFLVGLVCTILAASSFAGEYQTGSDDILRCTRFGRRHLAYAKILATLSLSLITFIFSTGVFTLFLCATLGTQAFASTFQMIFQTLAAVPLNLGITVGIILASGLLTVMAVSMVTLFVSSKCKTPLIALVISLAIVFAPTFLQFIDVDLIVVRWINALLPSYGIGLGNSILYELSGLNYLPIGAVSIWSPHIMLMIAAIEIGLFFLLTVRSYCLHQRR